MWSANNNSRALSSRTSHEIGFFHDCLLNKTNYFMHATKDLTDLAEEFSLKDDGNDLVG